MSSNFLNVAPDKGASGKRGTQPYIIEAKIFSSGRQSVYENGPPLSPLDRRRLILSANLVIIGVVVVLGTLRLLLTGFESFPLPAVLVVSGCVVNIVYLKATGSADAAAKIFIGLLLAGVAAGGIRSYGFDGPIVLLAPLIGVFTILLLESKAAAVSLILTVSILVVVYYLQLTGFIPDNPNSASLVLLARLLTLLTLCLVISWIVWRFSRYSKKLLKQIEKQSTTDHLTRILNRRGIEAMLAQEVARAQRTNNWLSLVMIDVDYFKAFNDNNGHLAGDQCLVKIAQLLRSCVNRSTDLLGRFGGEEFLFILPDTPSEGAQTVAETIRRRILDQGIAYGADNANLVTITLGVVSGQGSDLQSGEHLLRYADQALYEGKDSGRNCVVCRILEPGPGHVPVMARGGNQQTG